MRNIFDQYSQDENRLTHALMCTLNEDRPLLKSFLKDFVGISYNPSVAKLREQSSPDKPEPDEESDERKGIPDAWIYTDNDWVLLIESKAQQPPKLDQLQRHRKVARGFNKILLLLLTVKRPDFEKPWIIVKYWEDLYQWLQKSRGKSLWGRKLMEYLEAAERRMIEKEYLSEGGLTMFAGIRFNDENRYSPTEAKRLLRLLKKELYSHKQLIQTLPLDLDAKQRPLTPVEDSVWDVLTFKKFQNQRFNEGPHLTLVIKRDMVQAQLNLPDKMKPSLRKIIKTKTLKRFEESLAKVVAKMTKIARKAGGTPSLQVLQRHWPNGPKSTLEVDGIMKFDPRTFFSIGSAKVKPQKEWLEAYIVLAKNKKSNINFDVGVNFPYSSETAKPELVNIIADCLMATKPLIQYLLNK